MVELGVYQLAIIGHGHVVAPPLKETLYRCGKN